MSRQAWWSGALHGPECLRLRTVWGHRLRVHHAPTARMASDSHVGTRQDEQGQDAARLGNAGSASYCAPRSPGGVRIGVKACCGALRVRRGVWVVGSEPVCVWPSVGYTAQRSRPSRVRAWPEVEVEVDAVDDACLPAWSESWRYAPAPHARLAARGSCLHTRHITALSRATHQHPPSPPALPWASRSTLAHDASPSTRSVDPGCAASSSAVSGQPSTLSPHL